MFMPITIPLVPNFLADAAHEPLVAGEGNRRLLE